MLVERTLGKIQLRLKPTLAYISPGSKVLFDGIHSICVLPLDSNSRYIDNASKGHFYSNSKLVPGQRIRPSGIETACSIFWRILLNGNTILPRGTAQTMNAFSTGNTKEEIVYINLRGNK